MTTSRFAHHRLDAYRVAVELLLGVERLVARLPRGHGNLKDQLRRAATATVLNLAEGANRSHPADKAARFNVARSECGECDAALHLVELLGLARTEDLRRLADRIGAMLFRLMRRQQAG